MSMLGDREERDPEGRGFMTADRERIPPTRDVGETAIASTEWQPNPYQAAVLAVDRGFIFPIGGLGSGKSECAALKLLMWALANPRRADGRPTRWYAIAPQFGLIRQEMFGKIIDHARRLKEIGYGDLVKRVVYGLDPRIVLANDQVILGRSADVPNKMRGFEIDGFWGDEVQLWPWKVFRIACTRLRSTQTIRVVCSASPEDVPAWVWKTIEGKHKRMQAIREASIAEGGGVFVFRWQSKDNRANQAGVLGVLGAVLNANPDAPEQASATSGPSVLEAQELGGRFPGTSEAPAIGVLDYARAFHDELAITAEEARPEVLSVDVGETVDFTWPAILSTRGVLLHQERWNAGSPGVPRATFYVYLEEKVAALAIKYGVRKIVMDVSKAGKPIAQNLERRMRAKQLGRAEAVVGFDCGAGRKKHDAIEALGVAMIGGDLRVARRLNVAGRVTPVDEVGWLQKEFEDLVAEDVGGGRGERKRVFNHPPGGHDDGIVSLAMGWHVLTSRPVGQTLDDLSKILPPATTSSSPLPPSPFSIGGSPFSGGTGSPFGGGGGYSL